MNNLQEISLNEFIVEYSHTPHYIQFCDANGELLSDAQHKISKISDLSGEIKQYSEDGSKVILKVNKRHGEAYYLIEQYVVVISGNLNINNSAKEKSNSQNQQIKMPNYSMPNSNDNPQMHVYQFINTSLQNQLDSLNREYNSLKDKHEKIFDLYQEAKAELLTIRRQNEIELSGVVQQAQKSFSLKDILGDNPAEGIAQIIQSFTKNSGNNDNNHSNVSQSILPEREESINTAIQILNSGTDEQSEIGISLLVMAQNYPEHAKILLEELKKSVYSANQNNI